MIKKVYDITGFDCASCAAKSENHLNTNKNIISCRIDFMRNKLYISYKEKEFSIEEIKALIKEVEDDEIEITESNLKVKNDNKIFTKEMIITLIRVIVGAGILLFSFFFFNKEENVPQVEYWWEFSLSIVGYLIIGYDLYWSVIKKIIHLKNPLDENLLMSLASIGAFVLGAIWTYDYLDGGIVLALFQIGEIIEHVATNRSKRAIISAIDLRSDIANKVNGEEIESVLPENLKIDDVIIVKVGENIPVDGKIIEGSALVDTSSITGEFVPVRCEVNSQVFSGCIVKEGTIKIQVLTTYDESTASKILKLISESGERKSKADQFITRFSRWYTPIIFSIALIFTLVSGLISKDWNTYVMRGLELLVAACPCAIVISVPLAYFSAIGLASKNGIIIKGSTYIDTLAKLKKLVTDKTGTITHGTFSIQKVVLAEGVKNEELMECLYAAESLSTHPIAIAIKHGVKNIKEIAYKQKNYEEISGMGILTTYNGNNIIVGSHKLLEKFNLEVDNSVHSGTVVHVAKNNQYLGLVVLSDEIKETAQPMVDLLHQEGVEIVLLTGDKEENAKETCMHLGIDHWHSSLLPEEKVDYLKHEMKTSKGATAYIGDGINDAASIKLADVGVAMGGVGSDSAVENADIVIMNDDPAKVWDSMKIARYGKNTAIFNIVFALVIKFAVMLVNAFGLIQNNHIAMFVAVFADTGLTVLLIINSLLIFYRKVKRKVKNPTEK